MASFRKFRIQIIVNTTSNRTACLAAMWPKSRRAKLGASSA